eukprot:scaffold1220_cov259-Pinguiococcus_pyrenoidosus.AAC.158
MFRTFPHHLFPTAPAVPRPPPWGSLHTWNAALEHYLLPRGIGLREGRAQVVTQGAAAGAAVQLRLLAAGATGHAAGRGPSGLSHPPAPSCVRLRKRFLGAARDSGALRGVAGGCVGGGCACLEIQLAYPLRSGNMKKDGPPWFFTFLGIRAARTPESPVPQRNRLVDVQNIELVASTNISTVCARWRPTSSCLSPHRMRQLPISRVSSLNPCVAALLCHDNAQADPATSSRDQ